MLLSPRDGLKVEVLGPLRAYAGDSELRLGPPKQRATFAILALRTGTVVTRDELVDGLWGASAPPTAVGSLHTYLSGLRRVLTGPSGDPPHPLTSSPAATRSASIPRGWTSPWRNGWRRRPATAGHGRT